MSNLLGTPPLIACIGTSIPCPAPPNGGEELKVSSMPHVVALRAELAHTERHPALAGSPRLRRLLRYLFEESLADRGEEITQYSIAFDCYRIGKEFDSSANTLIRSHARRLRKALNEAARPNAAVRILMAERGYRLHFVLPAGADAAPETMSRPSLGVIGFEAPETEDDASTHRFTVAEEILSAIQGDGLVKAVGPFARTGDGEFVGLMWELSQREKLDFLLVGRVDSDEDRMIIAVRLIYGQSGHQIWAKNCTMGMEAVSREHLAGFARALVSQITSDWGIIASHIGGVVLARESGSLTPFEAVVLARQYFTHFHFEHLAGIVGTLRRSARDTRDAAVPATLAVLLGALGGVEPRWNEEPDRREVRELASLAARLAPDDPWTRLSLAYSAMLDGRRAELSEMARRAATEPDTPIMLVGGLGALLAMQAVDIELARRMIARYCEECAHYPRLVHLALAIAALAEGDTQAAREELSRFGVPWGWASPLVRAACSALEGDAEDAQREWTRVLEAFPEFPARWRETVATQWHESHLTGIFRALGSAGIQIL